MIKNWKEFNFKEVFDYTRGQRLVIADQIPGEIPYISSTKTNNGIDNYITPPTWMTVFNNKIGLNNSGSIGYCFYHDYDFVASDHVTVIDIASKYKKELTINIALFLIPIIQKLAPRYGFAREMNNDKLSKEIIMLPQDKDGNPDWQFMENYINEVGKKAIWNNKNIIQSRPYKNVDTSEWKEFFLIGKEGLFNAIKGERVTVFDRFAGEIPLITAKATNNGIAEFIEEAIFSKKKKFENQITIDMFFNTFYHPYEYYSDDNIHTLLPKFTEKNIYIKLFLLTAIKKIQNKYTYGRQVRLKRLPQESIKLPATKKGEPDWQFMEDYIKSLPYSNCLEKYE